MTLGIALLLIFILYLIDKHNRWRQAVKITVALVVFCILAVGGFFGWLKYEAWQETRQAARREAENAKQEAQKKAALEKVCKDWEAKHPIGSPVDKLYGHWDDGTKMPGEGVTLGTPQGCQGPLEIAYNEKLPKPVEHGIWEDVTPKTSARLRRVKATYDTDLTTSEYGNLVCGHVAKDETVTLLVDDNSFVKVKTTTGKVGWAGSGAFEVVQ
jgi:hypothetical protein